jgi:hypothetical protein
MDNNITSNNNHCLKKNQKKFIDTDLELKFQKSEVEIDISNPNQEADDYI